jgi:hypothetical protein
LDRVPAMISTRTEEGVAYTNKRLSDYIGAVITDLRDGSYLDYLHPDDRAVVVAEHIKSPNKGPYDIIYRLRGKTGSIAGSIPARNHTSGGRSCVFKFETPKGPSADRVYR